MTREELIQGYEKEIAYQKRMVQNLGKWFSLAFILTSIGGIMFYFYYGQISGLVLGVLLFLLGLAGMLIIGYGIYKGNINIQNVIDNLENKLHTDNGKNIW